MPTVSKDEKKIDWFLNHAIADVLPSKDMLKAKMMEGKALRVYLGIDPTGPTLHLGHTIPLRKLAELQALGHHIILLIGDFTAMIGDPTDKTATRKQLTREEVLANCAIYKEQASHFLKFDGENPAEFKFNSEWLAKMSFGDVIELASHFTVQQMMERDMFQARVKEQKPIHLHEFFYPLMQGYDSVAMDVDIEIGGNDQTFNMLAGRDLMKELKHKEKFVMPVALLADPTGKKMGKSEGNMIALTDSAEDMYGKVMSWTDEMIVPGFKICTDVSEEEIQEIEQRLKKENPMTIKHELARAIVTILKDEKAAEAGAENFTRVHSGREKPTDIKEVELIGEGPHTIVNVLAGNKIVASKTVARQLIEQRGVKVNDVVVTDVGQIVQPGDVIQKGPLVFVRIAK